MTSLPLYERFRPRSWAEVLGQPKTVAALQRLEQRGQLAGNAYFLSGETGTGKTTIARIIARLTGAWVVKEYDDPCELTAQVLEHIREWKEMRPFGGGYCIIVNEIHGLRSDQMRKLLGLCESGCEWITWIFTTTTDGKASLFKGCDDVKPFLHRCKQFKLTNQGLKPIIAKRAREIAQAEDLDGQPVEKYEALAERSNNSWRAVLQAIESGEMLQGE